MHIMAQKQDFLGALRRHHTHLGETEVCEEVLIMLRSDKGRHTISLVNPKLKKAEPNWQGCPRGAAQFLRRYAQLSSAESDYFDWAGGEERDELDLADYPYLVPLMIGSQLPIVDAKGELITVNSDISPMRFELHESSKSTYSGNFKIGKDKVAGFISDEYVVTKKSLLRVKSVGDNFQNLMVFTDPFAKERLESFLSIFFSSVDNVKLDFEGHNVVFGKSMVKPTPVLAFEKIDSDNSLYLRVMNAIGNLPADLSENFYLNRVATLAENGDVVVRGVDEFDPDQDIELVKREIKANAPTKAAAKEVWADDNLFVIPPEVASPFLTGALPVLLGKFKLIGAEKLKTYKITAATPKLSVKLGSGIDFLEGTADVEVGDQKFSLNDLLTQYSRNRYVTLSDGNRAVFDDTYMKRLERIFSRAKGKDSKVKVSFFDLPEVMNLLDDSNLTGKAFNACRKFYEGFRKLSSTKVSTPGLKAKLRGYQVDGLQWLNYLYENDMGGCLADDMGLGKTVQTIAMLCHSVPKQTSPSLIVMPRSLLFNWEEEFRKFAPHIKIATYYGPDRDFKKAMEAQVVLTSYAVMRNDIEQLSKEEFDYVILDESQNIKNVDAMVTKAAWLLRGRHRLAISGTPIENNLTELYSLYRFLNPAMFGTIKNFNDLYATPIQRDGDEETARDLRRKIFPFMLRRLKQDVLTDLPERTEQTLMVEMTPQQRDLYEERRRYFAGEIGEAIQTKGLEKARFELLRALGELRQIASIPEEKSEGTISSPKIDLLVENVTQSVENGHKVVVFYNFLAGIELTGQKLEKAGIGYDIMTGATTDRKRVVENFRDNPDCKVLLMTVKTGGVGLNLVNADTVFIAEPWWNKAAEDQAVNRLHRIGQKNAVNCYFLITKDTIEEKIRQLQEQKSALIDAVISSDTAGKALSQDDINYLLS